MKRIYLSLIVVTILFSSCSYRMMDFTIVSTKNVQLYGVKTNVPRVEGKYVTVIPANAVKEAIDRALHNAGTEYDALIDGVVKVSTYYAVFVFIYVYKVEGTPIKTFDLKTALGEEGYKEWIKNHEILKSETAQVIKE